ncbi:hypothetical protein ACSBR2_032350 [Camellia fascicularis]
MIELNMESYGSKTHSIRISSTKAMVSDCIRDPFKATVMALDANPQVIHAKIKRDNFQDWILLAVYASPNPRSREALWNKLESMADNISEPWLAAGDFNDFANQNEKRSFSTKQDQARTRKF